ncbi:outer membrane lipoprotein chaperone LolA [Noviluteimonas gilva]|uniref:Outer-membrane lipoprotein carrier protein n=1 Tax=Noviluteimonas gilva TaxID=2682097 RepID=A0A7C9HMY9_9GAMM|nr:outer membrane lipoprotein chaperone LolA [Lysobacter gilvus]MUV14875.1 outer membrane lipoprotein chaperone LolA [Lysobacter gilvus]
MRLLTLGLTTALLATTAHAGGRDDLTAFTKNLKGLDGTFTQQVFDANGKKKEASSGRVAMSAPRNFRWEYAKPFEQLIVADGKAVWVYDPDLKQVTKRAQGVEEQSSPLTALIDPTRLDKEFLVKELPAADGLDWIELRPRSADNASFESARLGFDDAGLKRMRIVDPLGQRTELRFSGWKKNPSFPKSTFTFAPPKGVDVVAGG